MLGGLTAGSFLQGHWQKRPLLVRAALPEFAGMLQPRELMQLACREDAQARVVVRTGRRWEVHHGPFTAAFFKRLAPARWTLLVQDVNHFLPRARELLERFRFLPYARLDDVMVSYAPRGGGVGPHFDSYDVFLLQAHGRRRWRIGAQRDLTLVPGAPLKLLARFRPQEEHVLEPGDMLYLPPGVPHHGEAVDACMTFSIGMRAPSQAEAKVMQERAGDPSIRMVQAPQTPCSHPMCVAVRNCCSRKKSARCVRGSTCAVIARPFISRVSSLMIRSPVLPPA